MFFSQNHFPKVPDFVLEIPHFEEIYRQSGILNTRNFLCLQFDAVCPKTETDAQTF